MELAKINPHIDDDNEADADVECALGGMETEEAVGGGVGTGEIVFKGGMETEGVRGCGEHLHSCSLSFPFQTISICVTIFVAPLGCSLLSFFRSCDKEIIPNGIIQVVVIIREQRIIGLFIGRFACRVHLVDDAFARVRTFVGT